MEHYHVNMRAQLTRMFPTKTRGQIIFASNRVCNTLKKWKGDVYGVDMQTYPFGDNEGGYYVCREVTVFNTTIFLKITVD